MCEFIHWGKRCQDPYAQLSHTIIRLMIRMAASKLVTAFALFCAWLYNIYLHQTQTMCHHCMATPAFTDCLWDVNQGTDDHAGSLAQACMSTLAWHASKKDSHHNFVSQGAQPLSQWQPDAVCLLW